jgi:hypothetical protein
MPWMAVLRLSDLTVLPVQARSHSSAGTVSQRTVQPLFTNKKPRQAGVCFAENCDDDN